MRARGGVGELVKNWGKRRRGEEELLEIYMYSSYLGKYSKFEGTLARFSALDSSIYALCDIQNC